jgi:hypothetical protein
MGDHLGTRDVAVSNSRCCRVPLGYGCPGMCRQGARAHPAVWGSLIEA